MKRWIGNLLAGVALAAVCLLGAAFLPTLIGYESYIVTGGSMGKAMPVGSVALTRLVDVRAIAVGDIISFRTTGSKLPTTHRVISITDEFPRRVLTTKGDANPAPDPAPILVQGSIHRVEHIVPFAGRIVGFARTPVGGVLLFLVPMLGLTLETRKRSRTRLDPTRARVAADVDSAPAATSEPQPVGADAEQLMLPVEEQPLAAPVRPVPWGSAAAMLPTLDPIVQPWMPSPARVEGEDRPSTDRPAAAGE